MPLQGKIASDLLLGEGEVVISRNIVDDAIKAFHGDILGHVGFIQSFNQRFLVRFRTHEQL